MLKVVVPLVVLVWRVAVGLVVVKVVAPDVSVEVVVPLLDVVRKVPD
jgi:hypothetical protein